MPELPEVETVKRTLASLIVGKTIKEVQVYHSPMIARPDTEQFKNSLVGQTIHEINRRGKWLIFSFDEYDLLSHLRMEGKYHIKHPRDEKNKHEHVVFTFTDDTELRYQDTRKFGRMYLFSAGTMNDQKPLSELGLEPWDKQLTSGYLHEIYKHKSLPIKTVLLDQQIITGIGNIYANEILFLSKINPYQPANSLIKKQLEQIIINTRNVLSQAIELGGTTIRSYTSSEGVHGRFQQQLYVHDLHDQPCKECGTSIIKEQIRGRGTYYCPVCQKKR